MAADGKTPPTHPQGGAGTLCVHVVSLCADTKTMTCRPCLDTYIHTYKQTINQYKQIVIIHKSIETYSYTYTWLQMVRPPQPTHRGGAGTLCVHVVSLCADTKTMTCRPCLDTYIHTYKQTINQYKQIVIIHKSIETYSYTYTWLQMVRPPQPTHRGGGGNIMCTCSIFVCRHKNNDMSTLLGHAHTYIPTDRQTHRHTYINQYKHIVIPIHGCICVTYPPFGGGGWGGTRGGWIIYIYIYLFISISIHMDIFKCVPVFHHLEKPMWMLGLTNPLPNLLLLDSYKFQIQNQLQKHYSKESAMRIFYHKNLLFRVFVHCSHKFKSNNEPCVCYMSIYKWVSFIFNKEKVYRYTIYLGETIPY